MLPRDDASELDWILFRQNGVVSRSQVLRHRPEAWLRRQLANDRWQVVHRGIYASQNGPLTWDQHAWVGVLFGGHGHSMAPLAGLSALNASGLRGFYESAVHIYVPIGQKERHPPSFLRPHRTCALHRADVEWRTPPRTTSSRAALDAASWARSDDRARAIIAAAFQQRLVSYTDVLATFSRFKLLHRRDAIIAAVHDSGDGSHSGAELDFLRLCRENGLPEPTRQSSVRDVTGRRRYRDAYFEEWQLHVEIDGAQHLDVQSWWADMQRQNDMWIAGDRVLRFPAWAVRNEPAKVVVAVRLALINAGWRP